MKRIPRTTHLLKGGAWDAAPFFCVLFPCAFFLLFAHQLVRPVGSVIHLPEAGSQRAPLIPPGQISLAVAVDAAGRIYFDNRLLSETELGTELSARLGRLPGNVRNEVILMLESDREVTTETLHRIGRIARDSGIHELILVQQP